MRQLRGIGEVNLRKYRALSLVDNVDGVENREDVSSEQKVYTMNNQNEEYRKRKIEKLDPTFRN